MPTSAAGNKSNLHPAAKRPALSQESVRAPLRARKAWGFTLIELLVVIALIAIGTAAVSFTLRDSAETVLERDAERLGLRLPNTPREDRGALRMVRSRGQNARESSHPRCTASRSRYRWSSES